MNMHRTPRALVAGLALAALAQAFASPAFADPASVTVDVELDIASDAARVRAAVLREIAASTSHEKVDPKGTLKVHVDRVSQLLTVTFTDERGSVVSRSVAAPADIDSVASTSALLAANLVRDQTSELVSQLEPHSVDPRVAPPEAAPVPPVPAPPASAPRGPLFPVNAAFFYPLASNFGKPDIHTYFDVGLLYTRVGSVEGMQASALIARADNSVVGLQAAALFGTTGYLLGLQASGAVAVARDITGAQTSGAVSYADGNVRGAQLSGITSIARGNVEGLQSAPVNVASDVTGAQIGIVNVGHKVRGLQLGVVNVADDVDGVALGVATITKSGYIAALAWSSVATPGNVGVKFATKSIYTIVGGAYRREDGRDLSGYSFAVGGHIPFTDKLSADVDVLTSDLWRLKNGPDDGPADKSRTYLFRPRFLVGYQVTPALTLQAGGGPAVAFHDNFADNPQVSPDVSLGIQVTP